MNKSNRLVEKYTFKGFGFNIVLKNILVQTTSDGTDYPFINMNQLKYETAKALIKRDKPLTGQQLKFLRTTARMSYSFIKKNLVYDVAFKAWESKGNNVCGIDKDREIKFKNMCLERINIFNRGDVNIENIG
jgi:hypothetical protein